MSPEASPGGAADAKNGRFVTGVRRVNNWPLVIVLAVVAVFIAIVVSIMIDRSRDDAASKVQPAVGQSSADVAKKVAGTAPAGAAEVVANAPPVPPADGIPVAPVDPNAPPTVTASQPSGPTAADLRRARLEAIREARLAQFGSAVRSPTAVKWQNGRDGASSGGSMGGGADPASQLLALQQQMAANMAQGRQPSAADVATLTALSNQLGGGGGAGTAGASNARPPANYGQFGNNAGGNRWASNSQVEAPSRYQLRAGFVIPGTLISGINSQIPGQIVAQVSQNVFDTATGRYLLIPQGSRLVGAYDSNPVFGQTRALIAWQRIVFPDGKAIDLGAMPGSDSAGYAGFHDQVNAHWFRIFGSALLMSGVTAGVTLSQPQTGLNANGTMSASQALSQALGQQLGQTTAMMIERNLNISPTLIIRPGFRFNVVVVKDLTFSKPYRSFDY
ncbi:TrbI/VirB10 family protein [Novosphingobium sp. EMRT-2]|uniref:TrbI/VirB10 family protein n=1 Tax=Novosphingobium sp. EMRT-2 TaxID=2571749 RepID=UPI0010BDC443|nr:TrbI/VirB10 family protein [Novosphingobium sp. EMRT-2]QCI95641.1 conjugal transfer protein TrbI [Novosphingobium sp. EMRT-2]